MTAALAASAPLPPRHPATSTRPAAVYLLQRRDGRRFKIGWAIEPMLRVQRLPEFSADELDIPGSHAVWLPNVGRAQQLERVLHSGLHAYRVPPGHELDGHTEWFLPTAHRYAIRWIRQMPAGRDNVAPPAVLALSSAPENNHPLRFETSDIVANAQDTLWTIEDLLLRTAAHCAITVERAGDCHALRLTAFRTRISGDLETLRWRVLDIDQYAWRSGNKTGAFVQVMAFDANDLVLRLAPMRLIRTWADGALAWPVIALLDRLRGRPETPPHPGR